MAKNKLTFRKFLISDKTPIEKEFLTEDSLIAKYEKIDIKDGLQNRLLHTGEMGKDISSIVEQEIERGSKWSFKKFCEFILLPGFLFWVCISLSALFFKCCSAGIRGYSQ